LNRYKEFSKDLAKQKYDEEEEKKNKKKKLVFFPADEIKTVEELDEWSRQHVPRRVPKKIDQEKEALKNNLKAIVELPILENLGKTPSGSANISYSTASKKDQKVNMEPGGTSGTKLTIADSERDHNTSQPMLKTSEANSINSSNILPSTLKNGTNKDTGLEESRRNIEPEHSRNGSNQNGSYNVSYMLSERELPSEYPEETTNQHQESLEDELKDFGLNRSQSSMMESEAEDKTNQAMSLRLRVKFYEDQNVAKEEKLAKLMKESESILKSKGELITKIDEENIRIQKKIKQIMMHVYYSNFFINFRSNFWNRP